MTRPRPTAFSAASSEGGDDAQEVNAEPLRLHPAEAQLRTQLPPILRDELPAVVLPLCLRAALPAPQRLHGLELVRHVLVSRSASSVGLIVVVAERTPVRRRWRRSGRRRLGRLVPRRGD